MDAAIQVLELTKKFGNFTAVDSVLFTVQPQDVFGLIGPNGAGKTTVMKMLSTILPPTSGDALVDNVSITEHPARVRELIGYVPQLISADGTLTGYENLLLFAKLYRIPHKLRAKRIEQALEIMGLTDVANRVVHEYSGGMIRRLEIIQAMLHNPRVLFLDEPTTGLDPVARRVVWEHLKLIHKQLGITIIVTTHDMQEADFLCNRIAIMLHAKISAIGTPIELKDAIGPHATLNDVFIKYAGQSIEMEHAFRENAARRRTESKRG